MKVKQQAVPRYKSIKVLKSAKLIPFKKVCYDLIDDKKILKTLKRIRKYSWEFEHEEEVYKFDLLKIIFNCSFKVRKVRKADKYIGLCWSRERIIEIRLSLSFIKNKATILHELAHLIQYENKVNMGFFKKNTPPLSEIIRYEQQAESIAYYLSKIVYPNEKIKKSDFYSYFTERDIKWAKKEYPFGKIKNDLYETKIKWEGVKKKIA